MVVVARDEEFTCCLRMLGSHAEFLPFSVNFLASSYLDPSTSICFVGPMLLPPLSLSDLFDLDLLCLFAPPARARDKYLPDLLHDLCLTLVVVIQSFDLN